MTRGKLLVPYFNNVNINKPIEEIYEDIDSFTGEVFEHDNTKDLRSFLTVLLPPFFYKKKFIKGLYFSQSVDYINKLYPKLSLCFHSIATSMWCSYPQAESADAYFTLYNNPGRENYFKKKFPQKKDIPLIPLSDANYINDAKFKSALFVKKDIDLLMVSQLSDYKNIDIFINSLKLYYKKYGKKLNAKILSGKGKEVDYSEEYVKNYFLKLKNLCGDDFLDYVQFIPYIPYSQMPKFYQKSKAVVMTSLMEGTNRAIQEALYCSTPIIIFSDFNKFARGGLKIISPKLGLEVPEFSAEKLADSYSLMMKNYKKYSPRKFYLKTINRKIFIDTCLKKIPYYNFIYAGNINSVFHNKEILKSINNTYSIDYKKFIYSFYPKLSFTKIENKENDLLKYYIKRFS